MIGRKYYARATLVATLVFGLAAAISWGQYECTVPNYGCSSATCFSHAGTCSPPAGTFYDQVKVTSGTYHYCGPGGSPCAMTTLYTKCVTEYYLYTGINCSSRVCINTDTGMGCVPPTGP
jgi:hypothetical protein